MSISAAFVADFSLFNAAVEKAEVKLRGFEQGTNKVGKLLSRFADDFSGRKIIQEAVAMERAVAEIGGVANLTEAELRRFAAAGQAAVEKMSQMGAAVPPKIRAMADSFKPVTKELTLMEKAAGLATSTFGQMFGAFSAATLVQNAVGSLVNLGKEAFDTAGKISDLSKATGLSTDAVQEFQFAAEQTGTSLDTFASASQKLGINLSKTGSEAKKAKGSVEDLGLSWSDLQRATQEEQFKQVLDALGKMEDVNKRNRLGVELLGKAFLDLGPAAQQGIGALMDEAPKITEAQIKALDDAGDAWDKFYSETKTGFFNMLGQLVIAAKDWKAKMDATGALDYAPRPGEQYPGDLPFVPGPGQPGFIGPVMGPKPKPKPTGGAEPPDENELKRLADQETKLRAITNQLEELRREQEGVRLAFQASAPTVALWNRNLEGFVVNTAAMTRQFSTMPGTIREGGETILQSSQNFDAMSLAMDRNAVVMTNWLKSANESAKGGGLFSGLFGGFKQGFDGLMQGLTGGKGLTGLFGNLGKGIMDGFGNIISGGISSLIGTGMSLVTKGIGALGSKLFKSEGKETNKQRDKWIEATYGSQDQLIQIAKQAGVTDAALHKLFTIGKVKDFEAAAKDVQAQIDQFTATRDENLAANKARDKWILQNAKGADELRALAIQAGVTEEQLDKLFNTTKVEDFEAAAEEVDAVLGRFADEQAADAKRLEEAITKYGFAWDELGSKLQQKKLDEQAKELIEDWRVLIEAGVDLGKVNAKMSDEVEAFLQKAKDTGAEIPAAMRPMLEKMIEQGVLTDASGKKIERLEDLGVTFAQTMTQGFDRVVQKLDDLIEKLQGTGTALDNIPDEKHVEIHYHHFHHGEPPGGGDENAGAGAGAQSIRTPMGFLDPETMPGFARGTGGRYLDFGSGTPAMLHGKERIITPLESQTAADALGSMVNAVAGLQVALVRAIRENALQLRDQALLARG